MSGLKPRRGGADSIRDERVFTSTSTGTQNPTASLRRCERVMTAIARTRAMRVLPNNTGCIFSQYVSKIAQEQLHNGEMYDELAWERTCVAIIIWIFGKIVFAVRTIYADVLCMYVE